MSRKASPAARLLQVVPRIYVGPSAGRALTGETGVLLGSKRPQWVDVLEFDAQPRARLSALIDSRFSSYDRWEVVGLSFAATEFRGARDRLLDELVPGDVLITEKGAYVHVGDRWSQASFAR